MMTRDEFIVGWNLLIAQPWGKAYRIVSDTQTAKLAATQLEFYHRKLEKYPAGMWACAAEIFSAGDHWPSVDELRTTLNQSLPPRQQLYGSGAEPPEPVALGLAYATANRTTFLEGMQAILPKWLEENPLHEDREGAVRWWAQFRHAKPNKGVNAMGAFAGIKP